MANEKNLKKFSSEYQPEKNGRPKGSRNRSTIVRQWLEVIQQVNNPVTGQNEPLEIQDQITLQQIVKALEGDTNAYKELMDSAHGKAVQSFEHSGKDGEPLRVIFQNMNESPSS
jgi:capsid portal protein